MDPSLLSGTGRTLRRDKKKSPSLQTNECAIKWFADLAVWFEGLSSAEKLPYGRHCGLPSAHSVIAWSMMRHQLPAAKLKQRSAPLSKKLPLDVFCKLGSAWAKGKGWWSWETQSELLTQAFLAQMLRLGAGLWMAWLLRSYQLNVFLFQFLLIFIFAAIYLNAVFYLKDILKMFVGKERAYSGIK